jgi:uncharacterized protein YegL
MKHVSRRFVGLFAAACFALAGCKAEEEETVTSSAPDVSIAALGQTTWPDGVSEERISGTNPFAENNLIVLDMSGSMDSLSCSGEYDSREEAAKEALFTWLTANPGDNVGLVSFSQAGISLDSQLGRGEAHTQEMISNIKALRADGGTPLRSAMEKARIELEAQAARQGGLGAYRMIVITDGEASSNENPVSLVKEIADNPANMIEIHTIGFCINEGHPLNDPGRIFYTNAMSPDDLRAGLNATQGEAASFDPSTVTFEELTR